MNREISAKVAETRSNPAFKASVGDKVFTQSEVNDRRRAYWDSRPRDRYIYVPQPYERSSYGSFSSVFMWSMILNAAFAHNHHDDPSYQQWRHDADERAQTDVQLRQQLSELDAKVSAMNGESKDPNYVPADVPPEVVYADDVLTTSASSGSSSHWFSWLATVVAFGAIGGFIVVFLKNNRRRLASTTPP